jgi:hypothetical protein
MRHLFKAPIPEAGASGGSPHTVRPINCLLERLPQVQLPQAQPHTIISVLPLLVAAASVGRAPPVALLIGDRFRSPISRYRPCQCGLAMTCRVLVPRLR